MRRLALAVLATCCVSANAASPDRADAPLERLGLRTVAGWLKAHGAEGQVGADLAQALGIASAPGAPIDARQRGFRSAGTLSVAQLLPDGSMLFMVQAAGGEVSFYHSTPRDGLRRALVSIPARGLVLPLGGAEAESSFRAEVLYWEDRAASPEGNE